MTTAPRCACTPRQVGAKTRKSKAQYEHMFPGVASPYRPQLSLRRVNQLRKFVTFHMRANWCSFSSMRAANGTCRSPVN